MLVTDTCGPRRAGYAEYAVASIWTRKPDTVSWIDAAALPASAEAAAGVLRQLDVTSGETLLLFGGGGSVGIIATQLAVARGIKVISAVGEHDDALARLLGATPVRYGAGLPGRVRALGAVDAVFDAAGTGVLADAIALAGGPKRVITLSDPPPLTSVSRSPSPRPTALPAPWTTRCPCWPRAGSACAPAKPCPYSRPPTPTASSKAATSTSASSFPSSNAGGGAEASQHGPRRPRLNCWERRRCQAAAGLDRRSLRSPDGIQTVVIFLR